jgi:hypothetical protein
MQVYIHSELPKGIFKRIPNHHYDVKTNLRNRTIKSSTYISWMSMINRCYGKSKGKNIYYSGKIRVYEPWLDFLCFLKDMGERPDNTTLGRLKDSGDYVPGNCLWQTKEQQINESIKKHGKWVRC